MIKITSRKSLGKFKKLLKKALELSIRIMMINKPFMTYKIISLDVLKVINWKCSTINFWITRTKTSQEKHLHITLGQNLFIVF